MIFSLCAPSQLNAEWYVGLTWYGASHLSRMCSCEVRNSSRQEKTITLAIKNAIPPSLFPSKINVLQAYLFLIPRISSARSSAGRIMNMLWASDPLHYKICDKGSINHCMLYMEIMVMVPGHLPQTYGLFQYFTVNAFQHTSRNSKHILFANVLRMLKSEQY